MKISYLWLTLVLLTAASSAQDFKGNWQATVQESGKPMRYVLHIKKTDQGFAAAVDVPVTFLFDNTIDFISVDHGTLQLRKDK